MGEPHQDGRAEHEVDNDDAEAAVVLPRSVSMPGVVLGGVLVLAFLVHLPSGPVMWEWAVSAELLRQGYWQNAFLHMFAHAGFLHIAFNTMALVSFSPAVIARLGPPPGSWLRYLLLFVLYGFAGLAAYLAVHPHGMTPMLGASGAIFGLLGFLVRYPDGGAEPMPLLSPATGTALVEFVKTNLILVLLLTVPALLSGSGGGVAWEGHLGGFAFGLLAGPLFAPRLGAEQEPVP